MSDEVPEFLKDDLLGLDSPQSGKSSNVSPVTPTATKNESLFAGFQNNNLSLFSTSPFYSSNETDNTSASPVNSMQPKEFSNFSDDKFSPSFGGYEQTSPHDPTSGLWNGLNSRFTNMNLGGTRMHNEDEQDTREALQSDLMFPRQSQPTGRFTGVHDMPSYNQMMWNGGGNLYGANSSSQLFSGPMSGVPPFSNTYDNHGQLGGGMESPIRGPQMQREEFRGAGSRTQMNTMRSPMQNGSMFPPMYSHGMMMQETHPGQQRMQHDYANIGNSKVSMQTAPGSPGHQRSASVDTYTENELFGSQNRGNGELQPVARHKRTPSSNAADTLREPPKQTSGCRYYANGYCSRGDRCNYDHILPDDKSRGIQGRGGRGGRTRVPVAVVNDEKSIESRYQSLDQVIGQVYSMCKDQHGCRFLQKKLEEKDNNYEAVNLIFDEVYDHMVELMTDPFGNYLCQKLIEHCDEQQQLVIVQKVAPKLVEISKNMHGTRAVQKMIECLCTPAQIQLVVNALKSSVVELIQDLNGNHVIQRCLNRLSTRDKQFIYDAVAANAVEVSTHRHGCCVMQRCIDSASNEQKLQLVRQISKNALALVKDQFGNYVVQYVLDLDFSIVRVELIQEFCGHIASLSTQKFSSNVIEKCLHVAAPHVQAELIEEVMQPNSLSVLLQDPFGNYVIQTALGIAQPEQYRRLVDEIKPLLPGLRNTPYGKRIQNKIAKDSLDNRM